MASDKTILSVAALLIGAYPMIAKDSDEIRQARLRTMRDTFGDLEDELLIAATRQVIAERDSDFAPSVGTLRTKAIALRTQVLEGESVDEYEAWGMVQDAIRGLGFWGTTEAQILAFLSKRYSDGKAKVVVQAIGRIGWRDLCMADEDTLPIVRAQFRNTVINIQRREAEDRKTLPAVREIMQQLAGRLDISTPRALPSQGDK